MHIYLFYFTLFCCNYYSFALGALSIGFCFPLTYHMTVFQFFLTISYFLAMKGVLGSFCISPSLVLKQPFSQRYPVSFNHTMVLNKYLGNSLSLFLFTFLFFLHSFIIHFIFTFAYSSQMDVKINISSF